MGLVLNKTKIKGTEIEVNNVYIRLHFSAMTNGATIQITPFVYLDKTSFVSGADAIATDIDETTIQVDVLPTEIQSVETCHKYAKQAFEQLGYTVTIDL